MDPAADNYAVFGNPVAHSKSPLIHRLFAHQFGLTLHYQAVLVPIGRFTEALDRFQILGGRGLNVTLPFKGEAWNAATIRGPRAERCGSVNTLWFDEQGRRHGETSDGLGLVRDLARQGMEVTGRRVLMLGAGGAVGGVLPDILALSPSALVIANRTVARAEDLLQRAAGGANNVEACGYPGLAGRRFDLIINGTSLSLAGEVPPIPDGVLAGDAGCYDMVYGDGPTPFCRWAGDRGAARISDGLGMLVEQAAESFFLWRGKRPHTLPVVTGLRAPAA
ncbi:MAG: shikimate dehydrogenase [Gammaproteobacteria bacterium]|nr:shikimate dehydrogenase [Gammaproteobacteria bacterium]